MKTIADLNALIPTLVELLHNNDHEIGESYYEQDEDGWGRCDEPATNYLCYDDDGWLIETPPCHDLKGAWGKVIEILASHTDEETDEESEFSDDDLKELWGALDEELKDIA